MFFGIDSNRIVLQCRLLSNVLEQGWIILGCLLAGTGLALLFIFVKTANFRPHIVNLQKKSWKQIFRLQYLSGSSGSSKYKGLPTEQQSGPPTIRGQPTPINDSV